MARFAASAMFFKDRKHVSGHLAAKIYIKVLGVNKINSKQLKYHTCRTQCHFHPKRSLLNEQILG